MYSTKWWMHNCNYILQLKSQPPLNISNYYYYYYYTFCTQRPNGNCTSKIMKQCFVRHHSKFRSIVICVFEVNIIILSLNGLGALNYRTSIYIRFVGSRRMKNKATKSKKNLFSESSNAIDLVCMYTCRCWQTVFLSTIFEYPMGPKWTFCHVVCVLRLPRGKIALLTFIRYIMKFHLDRRNHSEGGCEAQAKEERQKNITFHSSVACCVIQYRRTASVLKLRYGSTTSLMDFSFYSISHGNTSPFYTYTLHRT